MIFSCITERREVDLSLRYIFTQHECESEQEAVEQAAACSHYRGTRIESVRVFTQSPRTYDVKESNRFTAVLR